MNPEIDLSLPVGWSTYPSHAKEALRQTLRMAKFRRTYTNDVEAFLHDCFDWDKLPENGPTDYQVEILTDLYRYGREAVRGPHGIGKTSIGAWFILHFGLVHDGVDDWKLPNTASAWRQLKEFLWPEVHKWGRLIRWPIVGRDPFDEPRELQDMALRLSTGAAFAVASDQPASIEGAHADVLGYLYDEAKTIEEKTFEASEGAFAGAGPDTARIAVALGLSTPGEPSGPFYAIHKRDPRYSGWHVRHVTKEEAIAAGRVSAVWVEEKAKQWGKSSALYQNRVEGEFAASEEQAVIPLAWIEAAVERWRSLQVRPIDGGEGFIPPATLGAFTAVGVDVSDTGDDETVLALRHGFIIREMRRLPYNPDPMETAGNVVAVLRGHGGTGVIDGIGVGSGVVARVREQGYSVDSFIASEGSAAVDRTGEMGFANRRAEAWWLMRELLQPVQPDGTPSRVAFPADDLLVGDLAAPKWKMQSGGRILIEPKEDIRKRLGRSPDAGDAVVMSYNLHAYEMESHSFAGQSIT